MLGRLKDPACFWGGAEIDMVHESLRPHRLCFVATGAAATAVAQTTTGLAVAFFCIGCGSELQLTLQPVANLFRKQQAGWVISTFAGGFQISVLMFLILGSISSDRRVAFGAYAAFLALLAFATMILVPKDFIRVEKTVDESVTLKDEPYDESKQDDKTLTQQLPNDATESAANEPSLRSQLFSVEYILLVVWLSILLIPMQCYIGSIGFQLEQRGDQDGTDQDGTFSNAFAIVYASSALAGPPLLLF